MNKNIRQLLRDLENSQASAAIAVVDHIRTIASNGPEYGTPRAVKAEAQELARWALRLAKEIKV